MREIPSFFSKRLQDNYSNYEEIVNGLYENRLTSFRINTSKSDRNEVLNVLDINGFLYKELKWYQEAFILLNKNENDLKALDIFSEGKIYLQSLSSMIPSFILEPKENEMILDMTAAPGGKTTLIANLANGKAMITAIEKNKIRCDRLKYNVSLQGAKKVNVLNTDSRKLDEFYKFDKILVDAPCSGSGTINLNDEDCFNDFNEELINRSVITQKELLLIASKHLNKNGILVYSTCSILKEENEDVVNYLLSNNKEIELVSIDNNFEGMEVIPSTIDGVITVKPSKYYEGFFVAKFKYKKI